MLPKIPSPAAKAAPKGDQVGKWASSSSGSPSSTNKGAVTTHQSSKLPATKDASAASSSSGGPLSTVAAGAAGGFTLLETVGTASVVTQRTPAAPTSPSGPSPTSSDAKGSSPRQRRGSQNAVKTGAAGAGAGATGLGKVTGAAGVGPPVDGGAFFSSHAAEGSSSKLLDDVAPITSRNVGDEAGAAPPNERSGGASEREQVEVQMKGVKIFSPDDREVTPDERNKRSQSTRDQHQNDSSTTSHLLVDNVGSDPSSSSPSGTPRGAASGQQKKVTIVASNFDEIVKMTSDGCFFQQQSCNRDDDAGSCDEDGLLVLEEDADRDDREGAAASAAASPTAVGAGGTAASAAGKTYAKSYAKRGSATGMRDADHHGSRDSSPRAGSSSTSPKNGEKPRLQWSLAPDESMQKVSSGGSGPQGGGGAAQSITHRHSMMATYDVVRTSQPVARSSVRMARRKTGQRKTISGDAGLAQASLGVPAGGSRARGKQSVIVQMDEITRMVELDDRDIEMCGLVRDVERRQQLLAACPGLKDTLDHVEQDIESHIEAAAGVAGFRPQLVVWLAHMFNRVAGAEVTNADKFCATTTGGGHLLRHSQTSDHGTGGDNLSDFTDSDDELDLFEDRERMSRVEKMLPSVKTVHEELRRKSSTRRETATKLVEMHVLLRTWVGATVLRLAGELSLAKNVEN